MSEYQYYEFRSADRPLSQAARDELRRLSSRATISSRSFVNHYEWGNFKGDPDQLMESHFDLFLYLANWGSRRFSMRLPESCVRAADLAPFLPDRFSATVRSAGEAVVVDMFRDEVDIEDFEGGQGVLDGLAPLRDDVLEGDLRVFYLAWLMAVEGEGIADEAVEPLPGLAPLTDPLEAFANFFCIDGDLLAAASQQPPGQPREPSPAAVRAWIEALVAPEKSALLVRLHEGDPGVRAELRRRVLAGTATTPEHPVRRRTAGQLRALARDIAQMRERENEKRLARERLRQEKEMAKRKRARLDALARRGEAAAWAEVESLILMRNNGAYDKAVALMSDLRDLALERGSDDAYHERLTALRAQHRSKPRLLERFAAAGLT